MGSGPITLDTHSLLWYLDKGQNKKLSAPALRAIIAAEEEGLIYVPAIVVMETVRIIEKGRFSLHIGEDRGAQATAFLSMIDYHGCYRIVPIDARVLRAAIPLRDLKIHDRLVLATATLTRTPLVTKDRAIAATGANTVW